MDFKLMAPAGNPMAFLAALENGADSVYLGLKHFNARKPAKNFTIVNLKRAIEYAHLRNKKVFLTLNIDIKANEIQEFSQILLLCSQLEIDAVIVKDFAAIHIIKKFFNRLNIHLSTQCAISSLLGVKYATKIGAKRIVLARELELVEIKDICDQSDIEIEVFTEGSMCFSVSGRCLTSSWGGGKSGNRGVCTAPCRVLWNSNGYDANFFSMKDLRALPNLKELKEAGVFSVKIEGRLKKAEWVAEIVRIYRQTIDSLEVNEKCEIVTDNLSKFSAREIGKGHLFGHNNLIGENQEWHNYSKTEKLNIDITNNPFVVHNEILFVLDNSTVKIIIKINDGLTVMEEKLKIKSRKAKLVSFEKLINEMNSNKILSIKFDVKAEGEMVYTSSGALQKIKKSVTDKIQALIKKQESLSGLDKNILDFIKFNTPAKDRAKILGDKPNKAIINSRQIPIFINSEFKFDFDEVVIPVDLDVDVEQLNLLQEKYKTILSIPAVLYNKDAEKIFDILKKLQGNFKEFEANSFTGMQMLDELNVKKNAGLGLSVLNHIAARYLYDNGYHSVYASIEGDKRDYRFLSENANGNIDALVFAKLPLFVSRVQSDKFKTGKLYRDKYGIDLEYKMGLDVNCFVSDKPFSLVDENIKEEGISFDNLTIDFRFFNKPLKIYKSLLNSTSFDTGSLDISNFNFYRKLY